MHLACRLAVHRQSDRAVWNNGYYFSACTRCGADLIRTGIERRWQTVPKGYRVAWKPMREFDVRWPLG